MEKIRIGKREQDSQKLYARIGNRYDPKMHSRARLET